MKRLGIADIGYITVCPGLPIPPISREHECALKAWPVRWEEDIVEGDGA